MSARVFFYVQHLLGIGHLRRAATLARALASGGFDVLLVSGGAPVDGLPLEGVRFHQLPPLRAADLRLKELSQLDGTPLDDVFRAKRTCVLLDLFEAEAPDILLTEQFPFGRTQLRFELMPLLDAAQRRPSAPWIVSSIRDVLRRTASPARVDEMVATFEVFDAVLVHADPALVRLDDSFPAWPDIQDRALYTGYIAEFDPARAPRGTVGAGEVIVSVGGGAVGAREPKLEHDKHRPKQQDFHEGEIGATQAEEEDGPEEVEAELHEPEAEGERGAGLGALQPDAPRGDRHH